LARLELKASYRRQVLVALGYKMVLEQVHLVQLELALSVARLELNY
jgi:hypothetical protein